MQAGTDRGGLALGLGAAAIWGVNPLFFSLLTHVPPEELLAHRVVWAAVFIGLFCALTGRLARLRAVFAVRGEAGRLAVTAFLVSINWFLFILAVQAGRVTEAGIGYYIMPLVSVALGTMLLGERLSRRQWAAVALAGAAVVMLSIGTGVAPVLPLSLALSFALYGLLRKRGETGAITGFLAETLYLLPLALVWLWGSASLGWGGLAGRPGGIFGADWETSLLLMLAGPVTGLPLILFAESARRLSYSAAGLVTYLNPTLQVASAGLVLGEAFTPWHFAALGVIWAALGLYWIEAVRRERRSVPRPH